MKTKITSFIALSLIFLSFNLKNECKDFQKGTFELNSDDDNIYTIIRKGDKQIEKDGKTGTISEFEIKWLDDCNYILFNRKVTMGTDLYPASKVDTLYNEVIEINGDFFKVKSRMIGYEFEAESVLKKIE